MEMHAYAIELRKVFKEFRPLVADELTQRDYAWEAAQIAEFVQDIRRLYERRCGAEPEAAHFFGAVVAITQDQRPRFLDRLHAVVDGQQRLATFSLLWGVIAKRVWELTQSLSGEEKANAEGLLSMIEKSFLEYHREPQTAPYAQVSTAVFSVTQRDEPFFRLLLTPSKPIAASLAGTARYSTGLLRDAAQQLREDLVDRLLDGLSVDDHLETLEALVTHVADGAQLVVVTSDDRVRAHQLFLVLNTRGRELEEADSLRTYNIMLVDRADETERAAVVKAWDVVDSEHRRRVDSLLRAYFATQMGVRLASSEIFDAYRTKLLPDSDEPLAPTSDALKNAVAVPEALAAAMRLFIPLDQGEWPFEGSKTAKWTKERLRRLVKVLKSERVKPLLLAGALVGEKALATLVHALWRIEYRAFVGDVEQNRMAKTYFDVAAMMRRGDWDVDRVIEELWTWVGAWTPDERVAKELNALSYEGEANVIKYLLAAIEEYYEGLEKGLTPGKLESDPTVVIDLSAAADDHVFPQNPPATYVVSKDLKQRIHKLGNQALLAQGPNTDIGNALPWEAAKLEAYEQSKAEETRSLGSQLGALGKGGWTPALIDERQARLVKWALDVFAVPEAFSGREMPGTRRSAFREASGREGSEVWLVGGPASEPTFPDDQLLAIAAGNRSAHEIAVGDVVVFFTRSVPAVTGGTAAQPARIAAAGRVGSIDLLPSGDREVRFSSFQQPTGDAPRLSDLSTMPRLSRSPLIRASHALLQELQDSCEDLRLPDDDDPKS